MVPPTHRQRRPQRHANPPEEMLSFGVWLRQRRRALDLTQETLAQSVGCARITIRRIEADELKPSQQLAELLARQLGITDAQYDAWLRFARGLEAATNAPSSVVLHKPAEQPLASPPAQPTTPGDAPPQPAEIRLATILCFGFVRSLQAQALDTPEALAQRMQWLLQCLEKIVQPYGARVERLVSAGVIVLFGTEQSHEDDPERAIRAALTVRQSAQEAGFAVSAGITTGLVYRGTLASSLVPHVAAIGPALTLAEALYSQAEPAQILVSDTTYQQTAASFLFTPQTLSLPNAKFTVYAVDDLHPSPQKARGFLNRRTRLIGRQGELTKLMATLAALHQGQGQLVFISGEAGVGKSRLISELKAKSYDQKTEILWLEGRCQALGMSTAYWPVLDLLRTYLVNQTNNQPDVTGLAVQVMTTLEQMTQNGVLTDAQREEIGPLLGNLLAVQFGNPWDIRLCNADPVQMRHRTVTALRDFFVALAQRQPVALLFEDLHWSDELSLHLITLLMETVVQHPLLLICVYRSDERQVVARLPTLARRKCPEHLVELHLHELPPSQSQALVAELLADAPIAPALQQLLLEKAHGNPLFIEEIIRTLLDARLLDWTGDGWQLRPLPSTLAVSLTVQGVILSRIDRLKPAARQILQRAAVLGRLFQYRLLMQLLPAGLELDSALETLLLGDWIYQERAVPEVEYSFKHVLVQEVVYQTLLPTQQAQLHQQAAEAFEHLYAENPEEVYELLVYHYERSPSEDKAVADKLLAYLLNAGEKARRAYLNAQAIAYFQQALTCCQRPSAFGGQATTPTGHQQLAGLVGLGKTYFAAGKVGDAEACFRQAIRLGEQLAVASSQIIRLSYWLGETLQWQNRDAEALTVGQAGLTLVGSEQATAEAALMNDTIAWSYWRLGQLELAVEFVLRNTTFVAALPYTEELGGVYLHIAHMIVHGQRQVAEAQHWAAAVRHKAAQVYDLRTLAHTDFFTGAELAVGAGDLVSATRDMAQATQGFAHIGDTKLEIRTLSRLAWILLRRGQLQSAERYLREATRKEEELGNIGALGIGHANLGLIHLCRHEWTAVETNLLLSAAAGQKNNLPAMHLAWVNFLLGHIYLLQNRRQAAHQRLKQTLSLLETAEIQGLPQADAENYMRLLSTLEKVWGDSDKLRNAAQLLQSKDRKELDARFVQPFLQPYHSTTAYTQLDPSFSVHFTSDIKETLSTTEWQWCDPLGDCACDYTDGLIVRAANARNLSRHNRSAPRLLRPVCGDFAAQTICTPVSPMQPAIGGLVLWHDERNYLHLNKGLLGADEISFRGCLAGQDVIVGRGRLPTERAFLRLERIGIQVRALCSTDGNAWFTAGHAEIPVEDPFQIGLYAVGDIDRWFYPGAHPDGTAIRFEEFVLYEPFGQSLPRQGWYHHLPAFDSYW